MLALATSTCQYALNKSRVLNHHAPANMSSVMSMRGSELSILLGHLIKSAVIHAEPAAAVLLCDQYDGLSPGAV